LLWTKEIKSKKEESILFNIMKEFQEIKEESQSCHKITQKLEWWQKKKEINERLQNLLFYIEHILLGK
jgi:hypothetical protein